MLALVTGANGFVGSHLVDELLAQGMDVRVIVRPTSNLRWLPTERIEVMTGQLHSEDDIKAATQDVDVIYHVAGTLVAPDMEGFRKVNVRPTRLLMEAVRGRESFDRFVLVSSQGASGPSFDGEPLTEESPCKPISDYGVTKLEGEEVAKTLMGDVPTTIVRPSAVYGPRDENFLKIFNGVKRGFLPRFGKAERYTNLVQVQDLAKGIIISGQRSETLGELYFLSNRPIYSYDEFVSEIVRCVGTKCRRPVVPNAALDLAALFAKVQKTVTGKTGLLDSQRIETIKARFWTASTAKMERDFGWVPPTALPEGIQATTQWYREQGWL